MQLSGIQKFTMIDYPGTIACIAFLPGCNFRCGYCHNPEFVLPERIKKMRDSFIDESLFFTFLEERKGKLEGVVISGGEPTIHTQLPDFIKRIRSYGYKIKLDTNGTNPEMIRKLLEAELIDYIAMDIKSSLDSYEEIIGKKIDTANIKTSVDLIKNSSIEYEFRTTVIKGHHTEKVFRKIGKLLDGADQYYLQQFRSGTIIDEGLNESKKYSEPELSAIIEKELSPHISYIEIR